LALPALANDAGRTVTFARVSGTRFSVQAKGQGARVVYDSGVSDPIPEDWDTVLIQGESPDPAIGFQAAREGGAFWKNLEMHHFPGGRFWAKARLAPAAGPLRLRAIDSGARTDHDVTVYGVEAFAGGPEGPD